MGNLVNGIFEVEVISACQSVLAVVWFIYIYVYISYLSLYQYLDM